jgi:hypothetical protein
MLRPRRKTPRRLPPTEASPQARDEIMAAREMQQLSDTALVLAVEFALDQAREYVIPSRQGLPMRERRSLERRNGSLQETVSQEVDPRILSLVVQGTPEFWPRLTELVRAVAPDSDVDAMTGLPHPTPEDHATQVWQSLLSPLVGQYVSRRQDLEWDESLARSLVEAWRRDLRAAVIPYRAVAPLDNLVGPDEALQLTEHIRLRPMTDADRNRMWQYFGDGTELTLGLLASWSHVIDMRWDLSLRPPITDEPLHEQLTQVLTALRLHHPGVVRASFLFIRTDPDDAIAPASFRGPLLYKLAEPWEDHRQKTFVGEADRPRLQALLERVINVSQDRRMSLIFRRLNSAYERRLAEDALVDLWVAFEALVVPDSTTELRYRASLRIARLAGTSYDERQAAFLTARSSYDARSKVVHGSTAPPDLDALTEKTRLLARNALNRWLLDPDMSVEALDRSLLE